MTALGLGRFPGPWLLVALSLVLPTGPASAAGDRQGAAGDVLMRMTLRDGHLSAEIAAASLKEVRAEISALTQAEVRWLDLPATERISLAFAGVPVPEALKRILGRSFMLSYSSSGGLTDIRILRRTDGEEHESGRRTAASTERSVVPDGGRAAPPAGRNQPRAVGEPGIGDGPAAASSAGVDIASQPVRVRMEAVAELAMHADMDPAAREMLWHVATTDGDSRIRQMASMAVLGLK